MRASARTRTTSPWVRFLALPEGDRRELIAGELVETEMPTELHERIVMTLGFFFQSWVREHGGAAYGSGYKVRIDEQRGFMPDLQLYHPKNRSHRGEQALLSGAPDIAVEIISDGSAKYDAGDKLAGYARIGVAEYWLVSQNDETVTQLHLKRGKYVVEPVFAKGDVITSSRFPGLKVPVSELFVLGAPPKPKATPRR